MSTLTLRIPDDLKQKAMQLARKKNLSFNTFVNHWLQVAVSQDETIEWMKRRLSGKDPELLIAEFGRFLNQTRPGSEPTMDEINEALGDD